MDTYDINFNENFDIRNTDIKKLDAQLKEMVTKRNIKDSVFTSLFRDERYVLQLYQALFPDDTTATVDDIETVTLEYDLVNENYNDLGFLVGDRLIVLVEAQTEWSDNIIIRVFLYLAQTWKNYIDTHDELNVHSTKKVKLPKPEFFVIYTGKRDVKPIVTYKNEFLNGEDSSFDVAVKVIRDGKKGDIINQYVSFTKILNEQVAKFGRTRKAVAETIRICKDENVLKEYLHGREQEVTSIMITLYDYDTNYEKRLRFERAESRALGKAEGRAEGEAEGRAKGEEKRAKKSVISLYKRGVSLDIIAESVDRSVETIKEWIRESA